jgi:hypothetical protein
MRKPTTNESNVQPTDVLCDFCRREWSDDVPMLEGHQGSCICGRCLTVAYTEIVIGERDTAPEQFTCPLCLENADDRAALKRGAEPGWSSPTGEVAVICRRCIKMAAKALHRSKDYDWTIPGKES